MPDYIDPFDFQKNYDVGRQQRIEDNRQKFISNQQTIDNNAVNKRINSMRLKNYLTTRDSPVNSPLLSILASQNQGGQSNPQQMQARPPMPQGTGPLPGGVTPTAQPLAPQNVARQPQPGQPMPQSVPGPQAQRMQQAQYTPQERQTIAQGLQMVKDILPAAKNAFEASDHTPENGKMINALGEQIKGTAPALAMAEMGMYDTDIGHDDKTMQMWYKTTKYFNQQELDDLQNSGLPGIKAYASYGPGLYRMDMDPAENYRVRSFQPISGLVGKKSEEELIDIAVNSSDPIMKRKAQADLNMMQQRKVETAKMLASSGVGQEGRAAAFAKYRMANYLDTANNNQPITLSAADIMEANKKEPGRYIPATIGEKALTRTATVEDISDANQATKTALTNLKTDFTPGLRMKLAQVFKDRNPASAFDNFMGSTFAQTLTPDQQDYVVAINQNIENAMAMRSVLGAGQGSQDLRAAILRTIPGMLSPNKSMAMKQIDAFNNQLMRLARGIPKVKLRGQEEVKQNLKEQSSAETKQGGGPLLDPAQYSGQQKRNKKTGEVWESDGTTWKLVQ